MCFLHAPHDMIFWHYITHPGSKGHANRLWLVDFDPAMYVKDVQFCYAMLWTKHVLKMSCCISCSSSTNYVCLSCKKSACNKSKDCSVPADEETPGWKAGISVAYCIYCNTVQLSLLSKDCIGRNKTKVSFNSMVFFVYQYLLLAGQAPVSGHLSPTPLVAAYENHSRKRPAPVTDIFIPSRGCPFTRALTVLLFFQSQILTFLVFPVRIECFCGTYPHRIYL